jgi:hypothetical protein
MKFQLGDKVVLLHSGEEAEVVDFINKEMALVEVKGVRFPVYLDQIDFPYFDRFSKKAAPKPIPKPKKYVEDIKKEKATAKYKVGEGVWLSFLPVFDKDVFDDDIVDYFRLYLVNQTELHLDFHYFLKFQGETDFELKNEITALQDFYLHDVKLEAMNDSPRFDIEFNLHQPDKNKVSHLETSLKIKTKQLFKQIEETRLKQEASFSYIMFDKYPDKPEEETEWKKLTDAGYKIYEGGKIHRQHLEPARTVIDLHIEKLTDNWQHLSNAAKLDLQLKTFEKYYELALLHHQTQLIVIHGIGTGKLRDEIHDLLRLKKEVKSFVNQFHPSFGYGATEIYFEYKK